MTCALAGVWSKYAHLVHLVPTNDRAVLVPCNHQRTRGVAWKRREPLHDVVTERLAKAIVCVRVWVERGLEAAAKLSETSLGN